MRTTQQTTNPTPRQGQTMLPLTLNRDIAPFFETISGNLSIACTLNFEQLLEIHAR